MTADEALLQELVRARDDCIERLNAATRSHALRARSHAVETELADVVELIQALCARTGLPLPEGPPEGHPCEIDAASPAQRELDLLVRLLRARRRAYDYTAHVGDRALLFRLREAMTSDREMIRKHCEQAKLPLPPEFAPSS